MAKPINKKGAAEAVPADDLSPLESAQFEAAMWKWLSNLLSERLAKSEAGRRKAGAITRDRGGKRDAKDCAKLLWQEWEDGKHPRIRTGTQFAIEVMRRWPVLESQKVIERWTREWTQERDDPHASLIRKLCKEPR